ncbi:carbohydrate kinase family protein [Pseudothermotoga thermarum]|uniref:Ribokinase n=1 Tax=Pseudothermotoga thermarum DSM 5069 TaxID=688269 RepID=F7YWP8_9THEM|nr:PfkB family carbohydrate kinase [Pseudothermotoga thermarum]AEH52038.1 PfkB domain protein [Pseudothermotoga thermarum DSM 5069]
MQQIAVFGKVNLDTILYVDKLKIGENHICLQTLVDVGGKGANTAIALAKLGVKVVLAACLGNDNLSQSITKRLEKYGVDVSMLKYTNNQTGKTFIVVDSQGINTMFHILGANADFNPEYIDWTFLETVSAVFVQMGLPQDTVREVITMSKRNGKYVFVDPAGFPSDGSLELISYADTVAPNEVELLKLTKETQVEKAAKKLISLGVEEVLVKRGEKGATLFTQKASYHQDAYQVPVVDTTGAGDALNAAYIMAKFKKLDPRQALKIAVAASAITVTRQGTSSASPTKGELVEFLKSVQEDEIAKLL